MTYGQEEAMDVIEMVREGDVEDVALILEALLQRLGGLRSGELETIASLMRQRGEFGGLAVDAMTDVMLSL